MVRVAGAPVAERLGRFDRRHRVTMRCERARNLASTRGQRARRVLRGLMLLVSGRGSNPQGLSMRIRLTSLRLVRLTLVSYQHREATSTHADRGQETQAFAGHLTGERL